MAGKQIPKIRSSKPKLPDLPLVKFGQFIEQSFTFGQNEDLHDPVVAFRPALSDEPVAFGALDQSDDGVVALLQKFGELSDGSPSPACKAGYAKKELVLLRRNSI